ncbi:MAG: hypothetical protein M3083_05165 [Actinomycetota bacterium]|nr:hypothetical protein [Actinomycetota bacterium]
MNHDKSPLEQALDLALYGPLGLALTAKDALPGWVDRGRSQVEVARLVGQMATRHGQKVVTETLVGLGILPGPPPPPAPARPRSLPAPPRSSPAPLPPAGDGTSGVTAATPLPPASGGTGGSTELSSNGRPWPDGEAVDPGPVPISAELAIPGYDSLSASQVVQRLAGLAPPELEAVRTYEAAGRGRRTVLTKISQLQTGP